MNKIAAERLDDIEENDLAHMLATVNPAAAAAIDNPPAPPDVSTWVVYKGRAGFSRMKRTEFAALVLGSQDNGDLILMVVMEPEDMMLEEHVPFQSHNQEYHCWRHRRAGLVDADLEPRVSEIERFLRGEDKLGDIVDAIGKRVETVESVLASDEMEALEKRIAALESGIVAKPKAKRGRPAKAK